MSLHILELTHLFNFQVDPFNVWEAWGHALLRIEHYAQARVKFK